MKVYRNHPYLVAIGAGIIMAALSTWLLFHASVWNVLPWGALCLLYGFLAQTKRLAWRGGAVLGFTISYAFLWFDKVGSTSWQQFVALFFIIPLPSLFGGVCGSVCACLGYAIKRK